MEIDLSRFRETFFDEAEENIGLMETGLLGIEESGGDNEVLHAVFRAAHSIKGAAGTFGFDAITRLTHSLETLLDALREGRLDVTEDRVSLLLGSVDTLRDLLAHARGRIDKQPDFQDLCNLLTVAQRKD